jgi:hypothetical protein
MRITDIIMFVFLLSVASAGIWFFIKANKEDEE